MNPAVGRRQSVIALRRTSVDPINSRTATALTSAQTGRDVTSSRPLENTYKLEPEVLVSSCKLKKILEECMKNTLDGKVYDAQCPDLAKTLADIIKKRAKELGLGRYKFVSLVCVGPRQRASVNVASRCIWSPDHDTYAEHTYSSKGIYATAVLYGVYME